MKIHEQSMVKMLSILDGDRSLLYREGGGRVSALSFSLSAR